MTAVTIVMYHYVRPRDRGRYPGLKVRSVDEFEGQLDYIVRHYRVCAMSEVVAAVRGRDALPANACLLTFDDGFIDHYATVFPRLVERGLPASFYPPVAAIESRRVLDTHKIQIILAVTTDHRALAERLLSSGRRVPGRVGAARLGDAAARGTCSRRASTRRRS